MQIDFVTNEHERGAAAAINLTKPDAFFGNFTPTIGASLRMWAPTGEEWFGRIIDVEFHEADGALALTVTVLADGDAPQVAR